MCHFGIPIPFTQSASKLIVCLYSFHRKRWKRPLKSWASEIFPLVSYRSQRRRWHDRLSTPLSLSPHKQKHQQLQPNKKPAVLVLTIISLLSSLYVSIYDLSFGPVSSNTSLPSTPSFAQIPPFCSHIPLSLCLHSSSSLSPNSIASAKEHASMSTPRWAE